MPSSVAPTLWEGDGAERLRDRFGGGGEYVRETDRQTDKQRHRQRDRGGGGGGEAEAGERKLENINTQYGTQRRSKKKY